MQRMAAVSHGTKRWFIVQQGGGKTPLTNIRQAGLHIAFLGQGNGNRTKRIRHQSGQISPGKANPTNSKIISAATPRASARIVSRERMKADLISCAILFSKCSVALLFSYIGCAVKNFLRTFVNN